MQGAPQLHHELVWPQRSTAGAKRTADAQQPLWRIEDIKSDLCGFFPGPTESLMSKCILQGLWNFQWKLEGQKDIRKDLGPPACHLVWPYVATEAFHAVQPRCVDKGCQPLHSLTVLRAPCCTHCC